MTTTSLYNLSWDQYGSSLVTAVQHLRCHGDLVDVTLSAGGKTFQAHKLVLCAASPLFLDLLKSTNCKHPVILLAGIQPSDLEALLEFVYRGEVNIDPNQLPSLLQAAHCLNIQGLTTSSPVVEPAGKQDNTTTPTSKLAEGIVTKKRKRAKREVKHDVGAPVAKWSKVYLQVQPTDALETGSQENSSNSWSQPVNIVNLSPTTTVESLPLQTPILVQNVTTNTTASSSSPKIRGTSDEPGTCPLCGAMLRQARNLRRHLLISCKYRMIAGSQSGNSTANSTQIESHKSHETQFHELQTISIENLEQVSRNTATHYNKDGLTPIRELTWERNVINEFK